MFHVVARSHPSVLSFASWVEARSLWDRLVRAFPDLDALTLMPDHLHLLVPRVDEGRFQRVLSAFARWRSHRCGSPPMLWQRHPPPQEVPDREHLRRIRRYIHLNPCRAGLADDPLAWPFSTHRDAVGFAVPAVRRRSSDTIRFHVYVSADPTVSVEGTALPVGTDSAPDRISLEAVIAAVSAGHA